MEKTEEQIARDRAAVEAMRNAKSNMGAALDRIDTLERALRLASGNISSLKSYIAPGAYTYPVQGNSRKCTDIADDAMAAIAKVLA
jgi:hypothetical protein